MTLLSDLTKLFDKRDTVDGYPGTLPDDGYDSGFPDGVAGHVAAGVRIDPSSDIVQTPHGNDVGWDGSRLGEYFPKDHRPDAGDSDENALIASYVNSIKALNQRKPVNAAADYFIGGNLTITQPATRVVKRNRNRATLTIVNQGSQLVYLSHNPGAGAGAPDTIMLPAGASRTFSHKGAVYAVCGAGLTTVVDFVEENYDVEAAE